MRTLFRAMYDATLRRPGVPQDPDYATHVRCSAAVLMADMARVLWAVAGAHTAAPRARPSSNTSSWPARWASLRRRRDGLEDVLIGDPRSRQGLWELNSALLTTVDRMLLELDAATITVDPDQRRMRQALGQAARRPSTTATHRPDSRGASGHGPPQNSTEHP